MVEHLTVSVDRQMADKNARLPDPSPQFPARNWPWRWLSTGLIVLGLLLLGAGGLIAYQNSASLADPPAPVGLVEPPSPPSLEENPLPVVAGSGLQGEVAAKAVSAPDLLSTTTAPLAVLDPADLEPASVAQQEAPTGAPSTDVSAQAKAEMPDAFELDVPSGRPRPQAPDLPPAPVVTSPPTRIVAPAINLDAEIVPIGWKQVLQGSQTVSVWEVAEYAAGWHNNSALPGGGGNIVVSGHHNIKGEVFRYIVDLNPGDAITLYADNQPFTYTVEARFVVRDKGTPEEKRRENARWIGPFPDERVTLVTCWPYTNNTHRVIVIAKPTG